MHVGCPYIPLFKFQRIFDLLVIQGMEVQMPLHHLHVAVI